MEFTSNYYASKFPKKFFYVYLRTALVFPVLTLGLTALHFSYNHCHPIKGVINNLICGFEAMSLRNYVIAGVAGSLFSVVYWLVKPLLYSSVKMIVYLNFDDESKVLHIATRQIESNELVESTVPYAQLKLLHNKELYDGIASACFDGYKLVQDKDVLGMILEKHFIWNEEEYTTITTKLLAVES
jgi:hypothetical protein